MSHYTITPAMGKDAWEHIKGIFPDGEADTANWILFGTSGIHGSYGDPQEFLTHMCNPEWLKEQELEPGEPYELTYLILKPRMVSVIYGRVPVRNKEDAEFLVHLHKSMGPVLDAHKHEECNCSVCEENAE